MENLQEEINRTKIIRNILLEYHGVQLDINKLTNEVTDGVVNKLSNAFAGFQFDETYNVGQIFKTDEIVEQNTKIDNVVVKVDITKTNKFLVDGGLAAEQTEKKDNGLCNVLLNLEICVNDDNFSLLRTKILSVISHELNHAFKVVEVINKKSKSLTYNSAVKLTGFGLITKLKDYPLLQEFLHMFYLSLSDEINARVQQTYSELQTITSNDYNDTIRQLLQFNPLNDAKKMMHYNVKDIYLLDPNFLNYFIHEFNNNLEYCAEKDGIELRTKLGINSFFNYWEYVIKGRGIILYHKILRLVADKHEVSDNALMKKINKKTLNEITGDAYNIFNRYDEDYH